MFADVCLLDEESFHPTVIGDLTEEQKAKEMEKLLFVLEVNAYIDAVKSGEIEGEYGEF